MIFTIAWRELRTMFLSPLAWTIFAVLQLVFAVIFFFLLVIPYLGDYLPTYGLTDNAKGITEYAVPSLFWVASNIFLIVVPLMTMRMLAEERRNKTLTLLYSAPVSMTEIVLGKFLGALGFLYIILFFLALMPLSLALGSTIDYGLVLSAVFGLALLLGVFTAVGIFISSLTQYTAVAAIGSVGTLLLFWLIDPSGKNAYSGSLLMMFSLSNHYVQFLRGVFDSSDALHHLLLIATFLVLTVRRLDADRLGA
jgi:ABC-2 type transport system permease protein